MTELPAFQFYPGDWRRDPGVQALDHEHKGVWIDVLCLMHFSPERGVLLYPSGAPMDDEAVARNLGIEQAKWKQIRSKLLVTGVASDRNGALVSRRMVRDEEVRQARAEAGRKGGSRSSGGGRPRKKQAKNKQKVPPPSPSPSAKNGKQITTSRPAAGWSQNASELWIKRFGGTAPGGRIGKALKPLVEKYGEDHVLRSWERYLEKKDAEFASAQDFAAKYLEWAKDRDIPQRYDYTESNPAEEVRWAS